jgi:hypothetical protein
MHCGILSMGESSANTRVLGPSPPHLHSCHQFIRSVDRFASIITILHEVLRLTRTNKQHTDRPFVSPLVHLMGLKKYDILATVLLVLEPLCVHATTPPQPISTHTTRFFLFLLVLVLGHGKVNATLATKVPLHKELDEQDQITTVHE